MYFFIIHMFLSSNLFYKRLHQLTSEKIQALDGGNNYVFCIRCFRCKPFYNVYKNLFQRKHRFQMVEIMMYFVLMFFLNGENNYVFFIIHMFLGANLFYKRLHQLTSEKTQALDGGNNDVFCVRMFFLEIMMFFLYYDIFRCKPFL